jgi:integrase/recombinase XerC
MPTEALLPPVGRGAPYNLPAPMDAGERLYREFLAGRSPNTLSAYAQDLAAFAAFQCAGSAGRALEALTGLRAGEGNSRLLAWRAAMVEAGLAPATINRRLTAVRSALRFARTIGATTWVPEIKGLKAQSYRDTRGPGLAGTRALLGAASEKSPAKAARDIAIIRLMFDLGLRRGEVVGLDLDDVDHSGRRLWVLGKGRTQKEARTLPAPTLEAIDRWLALRSAVAHEAEPALFVNTARFKPGRRITGHGLYRVIRSLGDLAGIRARPHGLRHASITAALDTSNGDVRAAQAHARHANPQTTMRYDDNRQDLAGKVAAKLADTLVLPIGHI